MSAELVAQLTVLVLAAFVGIEVISKVPTTLHTPLMSGTNAIHGIVVLGGILLIGPADGFLNEALLVIAIAFGTINVVGGFLVTDRMLEMFKGKKPDPKDDESNDVIQRSTSAGFGCSSSGCGCCAARTAVRGNQSPRSAWRSRCRHAVNRASATGPDRARRRDRHCVGVPRRAA
jgi:NAD(P) transhydrogenase subunit alpha